MSQNFVCSCLNVSIYGELDNVTPEEMKRVNAWISSVDRRTRSSVMRFVQNSKLIRLKSIDIRHEYLYLKRTLGLWQVSRCAICEVETHALELFLPYSEQANDSVKEPLALVSLKLTSDENKIDALKLSPTFSSTLGIVLPPKQPLNELNQVKRSGDFEFIHYNEQSLKNLSLHDIEMRINQKVQRSIYAEKQKMEERIRNYTLEQNRAFEDLRQNINEQKSDFMRLVVSVIKKCHSAVENSTPSDKENDSLQAKPLFERTVSFAPDPKVPELRTGLRQGEVKNSSLSYNDDLFDMDDLDVEGGNSEFIGGNAKFATTENQLAQDHHSDEFQLQESKELQFDIDDTTDEMRDDVYEMSSSVTVHGRSRHLASSTVQNIPKSGSSDSRNGHPELACSLPIAIPNSRLSRDDQQMNIQPDDSIAVKIEKMAKSLRNENDIFGDRPRRRLNTGDLIKSQLI